MKEREPIIMGGLVVLLLGLWLGFPLHQSPRFAGSFWGGVFGVSGAALMLEPFVYMLTKRIKPLKRRMTQYVSMRTLLTWHFYAGVLGPILVLIHTGHKFESTLGIALTTSVMFVVISGFIGRYLMSRVNREVKEKRALLKEANTQYAQAIEQVKAQPQEASLARRLRYLPARLLFNSSNADTDEHAGLRAVRLAESVSDLEYSVSTHQVMKAAFAKWLKIHIFFALVLYVLLALHIWSAIHFGIRWFE